MPKNTEGTVHNLTKKVDNHNLFIGSDLNRYEYVLLNS